LAFPNTTNQKQTPIKIGGVIAGEFLPFPIYYTWGIYQSFYKDFTKIIFTGKLTKINKN